MRERVEQGIIGRAYGSLEGSLSRTPRLTPDEISGNVEKVVCRHGWSEESSSGTGSSERRK